MQTSRMTRASNRIRDDLLNLGGLAKEVATEKINHWYHDGRDRAIQLEQGMEKRIGEHPIRSVMLAAGVGVLAGYWFSHRRNHKTVSKPVIYP
jgi:hypothetical protein